MTFPRQGEVWLAQLVGKNRRGDRDNPHHIRRAVIVSTDLYNEYELAFLVAPVLASTPRRDVPTSLVLEPGDGGVEERSVVVCTQIRAVAPWRMIRKLGELSPAAMQSLRQTLRIAFDLI